KELHHTGGLAEGDADGGDAAIFVEIHELGGHERGCEGAGDRGAHESLRMEAVGRGEAEADQYFPAARVGAEEGGAARVLCFRHGERRGGEDCAAMRDGGGVGVVEFQAVDQAAVDDGGVGGACAGGLAEHAGGTAFGNLGGVGAIGGADRRAGGGKSDAHRIKEVQPRRSRDVFGQRRRTRGAQRAHELAREGQDFTMPARTSRHPLARSALSPRMMPVSVAGSAGNTLPAFSASFESSVGSSKGLSAPPRALSTTALISAPSLKRIVTRAGRSFGAGLTPG